LQEKKIGFTLIWIAATHIHSPRDESYKNLLTSQKN